MEQKIKKATVGAVIAVLCLGVAFFTSDGVISLTPKTVWDGKATTDNLEWSLPNETVNLVIASTSAEQELGLGDRISLASTTGMLFVFDRPDDYGFWMKDMKFPLDIIWLDQNFKIIHIEQNLSPSTYPQVFYPDLPAKYVIEVNAGMAQEFSLTVGQMVNIH